MTTATTAIRMTTVAMSQADVTGTAFVALDRTAQVLSGLRTLRQPNPGPGHRSLERSGWLDSKRLDGGCQPTSKPRMSYPTTLPRTAR